MGLKSRTQSLVNGSMHLYQKDGATITQNDTVKFDTLKTDYLSSDGHYWPPSKRFKGMICIETGGGFQAISSDFEGGTVLSAKHEFTDLVRRQYSATGLWLPEAPTILTPIVPSMSTLRAKGITAFSRTVPNKPITDAAVFAGELRQLPRFTTEDAMKMHQQAKSFNRAFKEGGSAWLNLQFGWIPFLDSIYTLVKDYTKVGKKVDQFERDSGRVVRRRYNFDETKGTPVTTIATNRSGFPTPTPMLVLGGGGRLERTRTSSERIWFSAAYRYYIPPKAKLLGLARGLSIFNKMTGGVTPSTLYQLAPWSWLLDYYTNVGDVIDNFSAFSRDNLVALYAYIMCTTESKLELTLTDVILKNGQRYRTSSKCKTTLKTRIVGEPYGFDLAINSNLSDKQKSILFALAASRV